MKFLQKARADLRLNFQDNFKLIYFGYVLAGHILLIDVLSKYIVADFLRSIPRKSYTVIPDFFYLTEVWNHGVSFGFLTAGSSLGLWFLRISTLLILCFLFYFHAVSRAKLESYGLALIIGGACGNIFDRFFYGAVYDFLDVVIYGWHFWTFNIADSAISLGAVLMIGSQIFATSSKTTH
ncbi:MAG: signal peptidase II [Pseudomonadota bacterium]